MSTEIMTKTVPPKEVIEFIHVLDSALSSSLFHQLKRANPKVSDQVLTSVVFYAWKHARRKRLLG
jgi:hypothetical protein